MFKLQQEIHRPVIAVEVTDRVIRFRNEDKSKLATNVYIGAFIFTEDGSDHAYLFEEIAPIISHVESEAITWSDLINGSDKNQKPEVKDAITSLISRSQNKPPFLVVAYCGKNMPAKDLILRFFFASNVDLSSWNFSKRDLSDDHPLFVNAIHLIASRCGAKRNALSGSKHTV